MITITIITTSSVPFIINHLLVDSSSKGQLLTPRLLGVAMVMMIMRETTYIMALRVAMIMTILRETMVLLFSCIVYDNHEKDFDIVDLI